MCVCVCVCMNNILLLQNAPPSPALYSSSSCFSILALLNNLYLLYLLHCICSFDGRNTPFQSRWGKVNLETSRLLFAKSQTVFSEMVTSQICLSTEGGFAVSNFYYTVLYDNRIGPRPVFHFTGDLRLNGERAGARFDFQNPHHH